MTRLLPALMIVSACHSSTGDDSTGDDSPPDSAPDYVHDPGLEGAPFTLDDPACSDQSGHIFCDDVIYSMVDGQSLRLDLYAPPAARSGPVPAVMYVHGGGWLEGSWNQLGLNPATYLDAGYIVLSIEYRLTADPFPQPSGFQFPDNLQDVKTAVRWLRAKAPGIVDGNRILAYGFSARRPTSPSSRVAAIRESRASRPPSSGCRRRSTFTCSFRRTRRSIPRARRSRPPRPAAHRPTA